MNGESSVTAQQLAAAIASVQESANLALVANNAQLIERFASIARRFDDNEAHRIELKTSAETALLAKQASDEKALLAALAAAKEAVLLQTTASGLSIAKSEAASAKQMDQITQNFSIELRALSGQVTDVKESIAGIRNHTQGGKDVKTAGATVWAGVVATVAVIVSVVGVIIASLP